MTPQRILTALLALPSPCLAAPPQLPDVPAAPVLGFESPPDAPPARVAPCRCDERPGPAGVYLHSGEFHHEAVDLRIPGRGFDLVWARKYRSRLGPVTALGHGWDFSYGIWVERRGQDVLLHDGNTRTDVLWWRPGDVYVGDELFLEGRFLTETFVVTFGDLSTWSFRSLNDTTAPGRIAAITDRHGNSMSFSYDALGRLTSIRDTLSRDVTLSYGADGLLAAVTDFTGRQVMYEHYADADVGGSAGDLKSVTGPAVTGTPNGNDFPAGKTTVYTYSEGSADERLNHNLLTITDPKGQTWLVNAYSPSADPRDPEFDRLVSQEHGSGEVEDYSIYSGLESGKEGQSGHGTRRRVILNDFVGNVREYEYDRFDRCILVREYTGRAQPDQPTTDTDNLPQGKLRANDPDWFETRFEYNRDARCTKTVHPNGNVTRRWYEGDLDPLADPRRRGNLRRIRRRPGSHTPVGDQPFLRETFEWEPGFGACCGEAFVTRREDARGNATTYTYDALGNLVQTVHRLPSIVEDFEYNGFGQLTAHTHPDNGAGLRRRDEYHYYGAGTPMEGYLMNEVVDVAQLALTTTWEYDPVGNVARVVDPRGHDRLFRVNQLNQVVREESRLVTLFGGAATARYVRDFSFDGNDNLVRVDVLNMDELGVVAANSQLTTTFDYDSLNFLVRETREVSAGHDVVTEYERDGNRNVVLRRWGEATNGNQPANTLSLRYDERDLLFQIVRAEGDADQSTEQRDYDGNGNLVRRWRGLEGQPRVTEHTFDAFDRRLASVDPMGNRETLAYDANGNPESRIVFGELTDVPGDAGNVRLAQEAAVFDVMDRPVTLVADHFDPLTQMSIGDGKSVQGLWWSDASQLLTTVDDNGNATQYAYDTALRLRERTDAKGNVTTFDYDENSNVIAVVELEQSDIGLPPETLVTSRFFDEEDRLVEVLDDDDNSTRFGYDSRDNCTRRVDALGNLVTSMFDGLNRRFATTRVLTDDGTGGGNPVGQIVTGEMWDDSSRLVGRSDGHGNVLQYAYDALNRVVAETHADGTTHTRTFDVHDNAVGGTDANGTVVVSSFDLLNRRTATSVMPAAGVSNDTTFEAFTFDGLSRLVQAQDDDSTVVRRHDSLSNLIAETQNGRTLTAAFDGMRNRLSCTYPGGRSLTCCFDELNRMASISDTQVLATWDYLGRRHVERRHMPPVGVESLVTHDSVRRIVATDHHDVGPVDQRTYQWDGVYNKLQSADVRSGGPMLVSDFTYDSAYRMVRALVQNPFGGPVRDTSYVFDAANNRESVSGDPDCSGSYLLDPTLPSPGDFQTNQYTDTPCGGRTHDENGDLLTRPDGTMAEVLTYDFRDRMVSYGAVATYAYDALGRRIAKSVTDDTGLTTTTEYLYDAWNVCEERDDTGGVLRTFVHGQGVDELLNMRTPADDTYFCADELGSVRAALQPGAGVVCRYTYGDYGEPSFFDGNGNPLAASATGNPYLFTGRRFDVESGLYCYRTRYLDPVAGRFTTRDSIGIWGDEGNLGNGFAYVGNNPMTWTDPSGLIRREEWDLIWNLVSMGLKGKVRIGLPINQINQGIVNAIGSGNPTPHGSPSGLSPDIGRMLERLKKLGRPMALEVDAYKTPLGMILEASGGTLAPLVNPVPIDLGYEWEGGGTGGLGLDAGGIREQMERKKRQGRGKDDDDGGDGSSSKPPDDARTGYYWDIGPSELVNPHDHGLLDMAIPAGGLFRAPGF